jgi:hypothetical protein
VRACMRMGGGERRLFGPRAQSSQSVIQNRERRDVASTGDWGGYSREGGKERTTIVTFCLAFSIYFLFWLCQRRRNPLERGEIRGGTILRARGCFRCGINLTRVNIQPTASFSL